MTHTRVRGGEESAQQFALDSHGGGTTAVTDWDPSAPCAAKFSGRWSRRGC